MTALSEGDAALTRLAAVLDDTSIDYTLTNLGGWRVVLTVREDFGGETADTAVDAALASVAAREYSKQREKELLEKLKSLEQDLSDAGDRIGELDDALLLLAVAREGTLVTEDADDDERIDGLFKRGLIESVRMAPTEDYEAHLTPGGMKFLVEARADLPQQRAFVERAALAKNGDTDEISAREMAEKVEREGLGNASLHRLGDRRPGA